MKKVTSTGPGTITPRFEKGDNGNPKGRPKGSKNWATVIRNLVEDENVEIAVSGKNIKYPGKVMAEVMIGKALRGDTQAFNALTKVVIGDKMDVTSAGDKLELPAVYLPTRKEAKDAE